MERIIIQGIQRLRVLTPYDYDNMDELVHDLSNALEESSCHRTASKSKKGKCWKRRSKIHPAIVPLGSSSFPKSSAVSEDSESSFEFRVPRLAEAGGSQPQSDSDDLSHKRNGQILSWRHCVASLAESDSVNENFLPVRPHRRKRKFKRMAVDPHTSDMFGAPSGAVTLAVPPKPRKVKSVRAIKSKGKHSKALDVENMGDVEHEIVTFCGKRKRSMREKSLECTLDDAQEYRFHSNCTFLCEPNSSGYMECDDPILGKYQIEASSSSLSSSESDGGIVTNDEGREADDEHSDFFHEPGPDLTMPEITSWWEDDLDFSNDPKFEALLAGSFQHLSEDAKKAYHAKIQRLMMGAGREIRAGRRRLGNVRPSFSVLSSVNETISKFMQDPQLNELQLDDLPTSDTDQLQHLATLYSLELRREGRGKSVVLVKTRNTTQAINVSLAHCRTSIGDIKRRRRMPPPFGISPSSDHAAIVAPPITENNIGNRILRTLGWEPGTGLGAAGQGIQVPLTACLRAKYQGLGYELHQPTQGFPPPPPPPSPQPQLASTSGGETTPHSESIDATSSLVINHFQSCQEADSKTSGGLR